MQPPSAPVEQTQRTYRGKKAYDHGIQQMGRAGYHLVTVATEQPRSGCMRVLMLGGVGALIWKPKPIYTATFAR